MDIAKYIGIYLLKNNFCYVHGLGNFELRKVPAVHDGKLLLPPSYKVIVTTGGSIDDNLAYFIATNEQVSISKAANELREFSIQARKDLDAGKTVVINGIGKFTVDDGLIKFVTDENFSFTPAGLPTIRNSKQLDEVVPKPTAPIPASIPIPQPPAPKKSVNWTMIILIFVLLVIIAGGGLFYYYYSATKNPKPLPPEKPYKDSTVHPIDSNQIRRDSVRVADSIRLAAAADTMLNTFRVVIGTYTELPAADKYVRKLKVSGTKAEVYVKDTSSYMILTEITCRNKDTLTVFDSLKKVYKYQDVKSFK